MRHRAGGRSKNLGAREIYPLSPPILAELEARIVPSKDLVLLIASNSAKIWGVKCPLPPLVHRPCVNARVAKLSVFDPITSRHHDK